MKRKDKTVIHLKTNIREVDVILQALENRIDFLNKNESANPSQSNSGRIEEIQYLIKQLQDAK